MALIRRRKWMKRLILLVFCMPLLFARAFFPAIAFKRVERRITSNHQEETTTSTCTGFAHVNRDILTGDVDDDNGDDDDDDDDDASSKEIYNLKFNISNLLLRQKNDNLLKDVEPILAEILEAACLSLQNDLITKDTIMNEASQPPIPSSSLPEQLAYMQLFMCTSRNIRDHVGQFRVFFNNDDDSSSSTASASVSTTTITTLPPNVIFSLNDPLRFLHTTTSLTHHSNKKESNRGGMLCDNREVIIWCEDDRNAVQYSSRVLDDMPFSQLQMGNLPSLGNNDNGSNDDGDDDGYVIELDNLESVIQRLEESPSIIISETPSSSSISTTTCRLQTQDLNVIQSILQTTTSSRPKPKQQQLGLQTLVKLIDCAVESVRNDLRSISSDSPTKDLSSPSPSPHLVLVCHSTRASVVAAALSQWKEEHLLSAGKPSSNSATASTATTYTSFAKQEQHVEDLLHQAVTVVTFGNICQQFCNGPAYIHISMYDDWWTNTHGVTEKHPKGGGKNAVYLHAWSPFPSLPGFLPAKLSDHDSHNMNACMVQFLSLVMRINGITSFRDLYNAARYVDPRSILDINPNNFAIDYANHKVGDLVIPSTIDLDLLPAMIRATGGDKWQWVKTTAAVKRRTRKNKSHDDKEEEEEENYLPDTEEASVYLEEYFGYSAYEDINNVCFHSFEK